ncbi:MAG TPA: cytochrome c3 family protein [Phycisphaerae bacterium]|nr:cytochrome c3 family protein [Phycisphaerae bacterium]
MRFWKFLTSLGATAALCAFSLTAHAAVQNTPHNMNYTFGANTIQDNQVCLPCHAPHNQPTPQDTLWNHVMPANGYQLYQTSPGFVESAAVVGLDDESLKCLSCHDGTVAVDSYGGYNFATNTFGPTNGTIKLGAHSDILGNASTSAFVVGGGTQDLSHDHPVGVVYPGLSADGSTFTGTAMKNPLTTWTRTTYQGVDANNNTVTLNYKDNNGNNISVAGGGFGFGTTGANKNVVGCGSCHTPHTYTYNFLIVPNTNSQLCLTCHNR